MTGPGPERSTYELTRFAVLRLLAFVYLAAFVSLAFQLDPLLGSHGLLPVSRFLRDVHAGLGANAYWKVPTLFWGSSSDGAMHAVCWAGIALSAAAFLGATNAFVQLALWVFYSSFVHVGQIFYGYGWELQLLETGFLAVFLCPARSVRPFPASRTPRIVIWLLRWLIFRVMVGAALIKFRGDRCWGDLTCLDYHFETQPNPSPAAFWLHAAPHWVHALGVLFNHFCEFVVPWFVFARRRWRHPAGALLVAFQGTLIVSGNLSFLNWLTIVPALACFDDTAWLRLVPRRFQARATARVEGRAPSRAQTYATNGLAVVVGVLSIFPVVNMLSSRQIMNDSFEPLELVNTYGAFGSVDRTRTEVILEGTADVDPAAAHWEEYELPCSPGPVDRRPCIVTPYHYRLDWQMWFVGNGAGRGLQIDDEPWLVHLVWQLLSGDPTPRRLFARDPFPEAPPRWIRAGIWSYEFVTPGPETGSAWWRRRRIGEFLGPISRDHPVLTRYVSGFGW